jgi:acetyltransferase-like isoleucine patch superfamily enzyme
MSDVHKHRLALCETDQVGPRTRIHAFVHILPGARIGADCNLCDGVFIENDVVVGDRVTIKCGVQLWDGITLEDDVFVGPNATFTNDRFPRSRQRPDRFLHTVVRRGASIGANATILPGLEIGPGAMVGAGAVVTRSVPPHAVVVGNPARIAGYAGALGPEAEAPAAIPTMAGRSPVGVAEVELYRLSRVKDMRGDLTAIEFDRDLPFRPRRSFVIFGVPSREVRGEHAHRTCHQFLICVHGSCRVLVDDAESRAQLTLDSPTLGLHVPPLIWSVQHDYSADAVLLVLASEPYDPDDYVRDYGTFCAMVRGMSTQLVST